MEQLIRNRRNQTRRGFTLIETMIAMAILGGGLLSVAVMQLEAIQLGNRGRHQSQAAIIAQKHVERLQRIPWDHADFTPAAGWRAPEPVETHDVYDGSYHIEQTYTVTLRVTNLVANLTRTIDVRVNWDDAKRSGREYAISSVRFNF
jgi:prepilin-type N-terminal cleavage/methylation domain-containing protein